MKGFFNISGTGTTDTVGIASSTLCLIHCVATPFIFAVSTCAHSGCSDSPVWWRGFDFFFLVISFIAVYFSARHSHSPVVTGGLYGSFALLALILINHSFGIFQLPHELIYIPAVLLIGFHIYNRWCCVKT